MNTSLASSPAAHVVAGSALPVSFLGKGWLYALNLGLMTALTGISLMFAGWLAISMFTHRKVDKPFDPVTIFRFGFFLAGVAATLRCGAEAMNLWSWDPNAATTAARVMVMKRYIDPVALVCAGAWMLTVLLSYQAMVAQLRKAPYPVMMLQRLHTLKRPAVVVGLSFAAAIGVVLTK